MDWRETKLGRPTARRALAVLACATLLYFAAGGAFLHQHTHGPDTVCRVCQALHMPALMATGLNPVAALEVVTWYTSLPQHASPSDSFALYRSGRDPPSA
jgi:hypothetical protein